MAAKKASKSTKKAAKAGAKARKAAAKEERRRDRAVRAAALLVDPPGIEVAGVAEFPEPDEQGRPVAWYTVAAASGGFSCEPGATAVDVPPDGDGRYRVSAAVRWVRIDGMPFTLEQSKKGYLRCFVTVDDSDHEAVNALQSAVPPARGAHGSTQHMTWELDLVAGARVGMRVAQTVAAGLQADASLLLRRL